MKKILTYYLLLLYAASLCKPLAIWFSDALAHLYFSEEHVIVHKHSGNEHVHETIGKAARDEAPQQKNVNTITEEDNITPRSFYFSLLSLSHNINSYSFEFTFRLPEIFRGILIPPPKFC